MKKTLLLVAMLAMVTCGLARGQSFEIKDDNLRVASLDGLWRFHTGDNPAWANPNFDDSKWALLRSDGDWALQGYKGYGGLAWYRFQVTVPAGLEHVSICLPSIDTSYEIYADGRLIGTYGKMRPNPVAYSGGGELIAYKLPDQRPVHGKIEIALRVWHWPGWSMYFGGGPQYGGGLIGDPLEIQFRYDDDRSSSVRGQAANEILGLLETLTGLGALALFILRRNEREYLWFSLMMMLSAAQAWIDVSIWFHAWNLQLHDCAGDLISLGISVADIALYRLLFRPKPNWLLRLAIASVAVAGVNAIVLGLFGYVMGVALDNLLGIVCDLALNLWIVTVVFTGMRQKLPDARLLMAPVILTASASLLGDIAWTTVTLGWQHRFGITIRLTDQPFPIDDHQLAQVIFLLALFAILILRFTRTRSQEERFSGEVQAARGVQQFLIPEHMPDTPGLVIESVYRPAREVGGDFFQVLPDSSDNSVLIVVGDVAGHGMESGMLATLIVGAIRTAAEFATDPGTILAVLNKRMQGRGLATCLALRVERDGSATLANAGHLPPHLNGQELEMEGALPLGAIPGIEFPVLHFKLAEGDTLMLMTDGVAEAQDAEGHLFGFERIGQMLRKGMAAAALASAAQAFGQEDDITVLTVERPAAA